MAYVNVKDDTDDKLHLAREPSSRSWGVAIGLVALGLGAAYYSSDDMIWKIAYVSGAVFIGLTCMEDWEDCILDKSSGLVTIKKQSLIQKVFQATQGQRMVVAQLEDLNRVSVQEEEISRGNMGYVVVLHFSQGYDLGVTETVTAGDKSEHERVAAKIRNFLNLVETDATTPMSEVGPIDDNCSTTSDESFEKIDSAELAAAEEELAKSESKSLPTEEQKQPPPPEAEEEKVESAEESGKA